MNKKILTAILVLLMAVLLLTVAVKSPYFEPVMNGFGEIKETIMGTPADPDQETEAAAPEEDASEDLEEDLEKEEPEEADVSDGTEYPDVTEYDNSLGDQVFGLYSLGGDKIADITVPEFLRYVDYNKNYITSHDDISYDASYIFLEQWDAEQFFDEVIDTNGLDDENYKDIHLSEEANETTVDGHNAVWKKLTGIYDQDIAFSEYYASVETDMNGVIGVRFSAVDTGENDDQKFMEIMDGISF